MAKLTLAQKLERAAQRKAKAEQEQARLKTEQRKERTRQLIELGGLIVKAKIDHLPPTALYAQFLRIAEDAKIDPTRVTLWAREGGRHFQSEEDNRVVAIARFEHRIEPEIAAALRAAGLRWSKLLNQWQGRVLWDDAAAAVEAGGGTIERVRES